MSKNQTSEQSFAVHLSYWITLGLILFLPLIYIPGFLSYSVFKYLTFGSASLILAAITFYIWLRNPGLAKSIFKNRLLWGLLIWFAVFIITIIFSTDFSSSFWSTFQRPEGFFMELFFVIFTFNIITLLKIKSNEIIWNFLKASIISGVVLSLLIVFSVDGVGKWFPDAQGGATIGNSSLAATYMVWNLFFAAFMFFRAQTWKIRSVYIAAIVVMLASPLFINPHVLFGWEPRTSWMDLVGYGRGALFGIALGSGVAAAIWLILKNGWRRWFGSAILIIIAVSIIFLVVELLNPTSVIRAKFDVLGGDRRLIFWNIAADAFKQRPILGWGPDTYDAVFLRKLDTRMLIVPQPELTVNSPHNIFFEALESGGMVMLLAMLLFWASINYAWFRAYKNGQLSSTEFSVLAGAFFAWIIQSQLVHHNLVTWMIFFLLAGFGYALTTNSPEQFKKTFQLSANQRYALGGLLVALMIIFLYGIALPYHKIKLLALPEKQTLQKRIATWPTLENGIAMGDGYDQVLIFDDLYNRYDKQRSQLQNAKPDQVKLITQEILAIVKHLQNITEHEPANPQLVLLAAKFNLFALQIQKPMDVKTLESGTSLAEKLVKDSPYDPRSYWIASEMAFRNRDIDKAKKMLDEAASLQPKLTGTYNLMLALATQTKDQSYYDRSLQQAKSAIPTYTPPQGAQITQ